MGWFRVKPGGLTTTGIHYTSNPIKVMDKGRCGLEIYGRILEIRPQPKAIIVSGHAPSESTARAIDQGIAWLAKPYDFDSLANAVADTLRDSSKPLC